MFKIGDNGKMKMPLMCRIKNALRLRLVSPSKAFYYGCSFGIHYADERCEQCPCNLKNSLLGQFVQGINEGMKR